MKCIYCGDTGKWKQPNDQKKFDYWYDHFLEIADFNSPYMAEKKAYEKVGYSVISCPYCKSNTEEESDND